MEEPKLVRLKPPRETLPVLGEMTFVWYPSLGLPQAERPSLHQEQLRAILLALEELAKAQGRCSTSSPGAQQRTCRSSCQELLPNFRLRPYSHHEFPEPAGPPGLYLK